MASALPQQPDSNPGQELCRLAQTQAQQEQGDAEPGMTPVCWSSLLGDVVLHG